MPGFLHFLHSQLFYTPPSPEISCKGKTFIITGANVGLGKEAARHHVRLGADKVILACRSTEKGAAAKQDIETSTGRRDVVEVWPLDLESYPSVQAFAERVSRLKRIDAVLENAGVAKTKFQMVAGYESTLTVNVVSTFLLALLLIPKLQAVGREFDIRPTLTIVSSEVHAFAKFPQADAPVIFDALNREDPKTWAERYPLSKLLEILAVREIVRGHPAARLQVTINTVNPGLCQSELAREQPGIVFPIMKFLLARSTEVGARTLVHASLQGPESHGAYLSDCKAAEVAGRAAGEDAPKLQQRVWKELKANLENIQLGVTKVLDT